MQDGCFFKEEETKQLTAKTEDKNFKGVDMLLTSDWPKDITQYGNKLVCQLNQCMGDEDGNDGDEVPYNLLQVDASADASETGSEIISKLAVKLRPRYHFTALDNTFYERLPYRYKLLGFVVA